MARDPILDLFGTDPEMTSEIARVRALRGDPMKAERLMRLGAVAGLSTDEGLRGMSDQLTRIGAVQKDRYDQAAEEAYTGLKQTRAKAAETEENKRRWEAEQRLREQNARDMAEMRRIQLANAQEGLALRRAAAERAATAATAAQEAKGVALGMKQRAEQQGIQRAIASGEENLRTIDQALTHPGRKAATGASGAIATHLPFTEARNFQSVHNKLLGGAFLEAFSSLKGGGQITEIEGKKATDAITRLNTPGLTEGEYELALNELRSVVTLGIDRAKQQGYDVGMFKDIPGLPSGNPAAQAQQPNAFGMPQGSRAQRYLDMVGGG